MFLGLANVALWGVTRAYFVSGSHFPASHAHPLFQSILQSQARLSAKLQADKCWSSHFSPRLQGGNEGGRTKRREGERQRTGLSTYSAHFHLPWSRAELFSSSRAGGCALGSARDVIDCAGSATCPVEMMGWVIVPGATSEGGRSAEPSIMGSTTTRSMASRVAQNSRTPSARPGSAAMSMAQAWSGSSLSEDSRRSRLGSSRNNAWESATRLTIEMVIAVHPI
jgi:hypothetical protein